MGLAEREEVFGRGVGVFVVDCFIIDIRFESNNSFNLIVFVVCHTS